MGDRNTNKSRNAKFAPAAVLASGAIARAATCAFSMALATVSTGVPARLQSTKEFFRLARGGQPILKAYTCLYQVCSLKAGNQAKSIHGNASRNSGSGPRCGCAEKSIGVGVAAGFRFCYRRLPQSKTPGG